MQAEKKPRKKAALDAPKIGITKHGFTIEETLLLEDYTVYLSLSPLGRMCCILEAATNDNEEFVLDEGDDRRDKYKPDILHFSSLGVSVHLDGKVVHYKSANKKQVDSRVYPCIHYVNFLRSPYEYLKYIDTFYTFTDNAFHVECVTSLKKVDSLLAFIEQHDGVIRSDYTAILDVATKISSLKEDTLINAFSNNDNASSYNANMKSLQNLYEELYSSLSSYKLKCDELLVNITRIIEVPKQQQISREEVEPVKSEPVKVRTVKTSVKKSVK